MEKTMKKQKNRGRRQMVFGIFRKSAIVMALLLIFGQASAAGIVYASQNTVADADTRQDYKVTLGAETSTRNAGRIWVDKSVSAEDIVFSGDISSDKIQIKKGDADFLVTYSALAASQSIVSEQPVDVVFILDLSASMCWGTDSEVVSASDGSDSRIRAMVDSLNSAADLLVESNENNRIAVTVFNGSSATLLELTETGEIEDIVPDGGKYFSLSSFTGTSGADNGRAEVTCNINQRQTGTAGGTNIHAGLYEGMNILAKVPDTTFSTAKGQVVRIPNIVLMSDGAPTTFASAFDAQWTDNSGISQTGTINRSSDVRGQDTKSGSWWNGVSDEAIGGGDNDTPHSANGFMVLLSASYMKNKITEHYYGTESGDALNIYTIGFSTDRQTPGMAEMANLVLNPAEHLGQADQSSTEVVSQTAQAWKTFRAGGSPVVYGKLGANGDERQYHVSVPSAGIDVETLEYPSEYYKASDASGLNKAFLEIISQIIESAQVPTEIAGGSDAFHSGYITYSDPIGSYMELRDVKALIYGGELLNVSSTKTEGNTTSYHFEGKIDSPVYGTLDASLIETKVEEIRDPDTKEIRQTLTVRIPAAVIPMRVNSLTINPDGSVADHIYNQAYPLRVVYGVGVQKEMIDDSGFLTLSQVREDYLEKHLSADGMLELFANHYSAKSDDGYADTQADGKTIGDASVTFTPAEINPFYYVQENMPLYADPDCTVPAKGQIDKDSIYYMKIHYYDGNDAKTDVVSRKGSLFMAADGQAVAAATGTDGQMELQAGAPRLGNLSEFVRDKKSTEITRTAESYYYPTYQGNGLFRVYLGNNGVLKAEVQDIPSEDTPADDPAADGNNSSPGTTEPEGSGSPDPDISDTDLTETDSGNKETTDDGSTDSAAEKGKNTDTAQTGDDLNILPLTAAMMTALLISLAAVAVIRKRRGR